MNDDAGRRRGDAEEGKPERFPKIYTVRDVARILRLDPGTVYRKHRAGKLPEPLPYSKSHRWNGHEFDRWVEEGCPVRQEAGRNGKEADTRSKAGRARARRKDNG